jgi:hypothetical protein
MDKTIESILRYAAADARYTYDSRLLSLYSKNLDLKV